MILDTGAFIHGDALKPADPIRLARALRTLARVLEIARPVLSYVPIRYRWAIGMAVDVVVGAMLAYADQLDADSAEPDGHGWRTDEPESPGRYLVTISHRGVCRISTAWWDPSLFGSVRNSSGWDQLSVIAWQPLPPPFRGDS